MSRVINWPTDADLRDEIQRTSHSAVARRLNVSRYSLYHRIRYKGARARHHWNWPTDLLDQIRQTSIRAVSKSLGIPTATIYCRLHNHHPEWTPQPPQVPKSKLPKPTVLRPLRPPKPKPPKPAPKPKSPKPPLPPNPLAINWPDNLPELVQFNGVNATLRSLRVSRSSLYYRLAKHRNGNIPPPAIIRHSKQSKSPPPTSPKINRLWINWPADLRERVEQTSTTEVARQYGTSASVVRSALQRQHPGIKLPHKSKQAKPHLNGQGIPEYLEQLVTPTARQIQELRAIAVRKETSYADYEAITRYVIKVTAIPDVPFIYSKS